MGPGVLSEDSWYGSSFKSASGSSPNWDASVNLLMIKMAKSRERLRKLPTKTRRRNVHPEGRFGGRRARRGQKYVPLMLCTKITRSCLDHIQYIHTHTYCTTYVSPVNKKNVNKREA